MAQTLQIYRASPHINLFLINFSKILRYVSHKERIFASRFFD